MKANFKIEKNEELENKKSDNVVEKQKDATEEEFEDFVIKAGAAGSFMVFRSDKQKDNELGIDEL